MGNPVDPLWLLQSVSYNLPWCHVWTSGYTGVCSAPCVPASSPPKRESCPGAVVFNIMIGAHPRLHFGSSADNVKDSHEGRQNGCRLSAPCTHRGHSCSLHIHSLTRTYSHFFSPRRAPTAPAVECLAAAGLAPALSPPRGRDWPADGRHQPRAAPAEGSGRCPPLGSRPSPRCPPLGSRPSPPAGSPQPGPPRPSGPPAGSRPSPVGVGPGRRRCRRGAPAAAAGGGGGGSGRVPHITRPLCSARSSLLPAAAWGRRSPCAAAWPWLGASALRASPGEQPELPRLGRTELALALRLRAPASFLPSAAFSRSACKSPARGRRDSPARVGIKPDFPLPRCTAIAPSPATASPRAGRARTPSPPLSPPAARRGCGCRCWARCSCCPSAAARAPRSSRLPEPSARPAAMSPSAPAPAAPAATSPTAATAASSAPRARGTPAAARRTRPAGTASTAATPWASASPRGSASASSAPRCAAATAGPTTTSASWRRWAARRCSTACPPSPRSRREPVNRVGAWWGLPVGQREAGGRRRGVLVAGIRKILIFQWPGTAGWLQGPWEATRSRRLACLGLPWRGEGALGSFLKGKSHPPWSSLWARGLGLRPGKVSAQ